MPSFEQMKQVDTNTTFKWYYQPWFATTYSKKVGIMWALF